VSSRTGPLDDSVRRGRLVITGLRVTPIALPDPPLLAASGCHGPYFLRTLVEVTTDAGVTGIGETHGGERIALALEKAREHVLGENALAHRSLATRVLAGGAPLSAWAGIELACLDACGRALGLRLCELLGGPVRETVEFPAYLFFRYAADHPVLLADPRIVRSADGRWTVATAVRIGAALRDLPLEYYEDPVDGQEAMAEVRRRTGLKLSTNSCVTSFEHIAQAVRTGPIDVVLGDHHVWGGIPAVQELGRICAALGWGLSQHSNHHAGATMAAMAHVGAAVPQLTYESDTHFPWLPEGADVIAGGKLAIAGGCVRVPPGPGLGVEFDRDQVARAREVYEKCGMRKRDDAGTMRMVEPGWERTRF
jgi:glucarate dehydratase